jgi:hypothetical protein
VRFVAVLDGYSANRQQDEEAFAAGMRLLADMPNVLANTRAGSPTYVE